MFRRQNETVCLKVMNGCHYGTPLRKNAAEKYCREEADGRLMAISSHEEREWLHSMPERDCKKLLKNFQRSVLYFTTMHPCLLLDTAIENAN